MKRSKIFVVFMKAHNREVLDFIGIRDHTQVVSYSYSIDLSLSLTELKDQTRRADPEVYEAVVQAYIRGDKRLTLSMRAGKMPNICGVATELRNILMEFN